MCNALDTYLRLVCLSLNRVTGSCLWPFWGKGENSAINIYRLIRLYFNTHVTNMYACGPSSRQLWLIPFLLF